MITKQMLGTAAIARVQGDEFYIASVQDALDMIGTIWYEVEGAKAVVIDKAILSEAFFDLRTGLAGEVLQKFTNYNMKLAIIGDFSGYTSKALADFIRESNRGTSIFFADDQAQAFFLLAAALG